MSKIPNVNWKGVHITDLRRKKLKLNQRQFAKLLGVSSGAVAMWELNDDPPPGQCLRLLMVLDRIPKARLNQDSWKRMLESGQAEGAFLYLVLGKRTRTH